MNITTASILGALAVIVIGTGAYFMTSGSQTAAVHDAMMQDTSADTSGDAMMHDDAMASTSGDAMMDDSMSSSTEGDAMMAH